MKRKRLFWQIFPSYVLLALGLLLVVWLSGRRILEESYRRQAAAALEASGRFFAERINAALDRGDTAEIDALAKKLGKASATRITVFLPAGKVIAESDEDPALLDDRRNRPEIAAALDARKARSAVRYSETLRQEFLYVALPVLRDGDPRAVVRMAMPVKAIDGALAAAENQIVLGAVIAAAVVLGGSWLLARRISRPLEIIAAGARRFGGGDLDCRVPLAGSQEIAACAEAMNTMAAQLRQQIETIVYQSNEQDAVLSSMVEGVLTLDNQGAILQLNRSGGQMLQVDPARVRGREIHEVLRKAALLKFVDAALASSLPVHEEMVIYDRQQRFLSGSGNVLRDAENRRIGVVIVLRDVTHLRRLENVRRDFVANASRELRLPVTTIKGCVENLLAGVPGEKENAEQLLHTILKQVNRLAAILDDILSLAQMEKETEEQSVVLQPGSLRDVLDAAIQRCTEKARSKEIRLVLSVDQDVVAAISPELLTQALVNLIDNALNYSPSGGAVQLSAAREEGGVVIRVVDEGCGIEAKHLPRLFERFYRVDDARSRHLGGTGLGLAIVKHVALAHGGSVSVKSRIGAGSTFSIELPGN